MPSTTDSPGPKRPVRVALLGTGVIAAPHAEALRTLAGSVELVAVCDLDSTRAQAFQRAWTVPAVFEDLADMLAVSHPDVVHVLLPPAAHAAAAIRCLEAGCHVLVEKPFCLSSQECRSVMDAAAATARQIGVNHNLTFMPPFLRMVEQIRNWRLGAIQHVTVTYNLPLPVLDTGPHGHWMFGGPERMVLELGPHPLSIIQLLLGSVQSASALASDRRRLTNGQVFWDTWQSSFACERGSAQCFLAFGGQYVSTAIHVVGQDGEAFADLRRNTVRISEKTRYPRTDFLRDGWRNGTSLIRQSLRNHYDNQRNMFGFGPASAMQTRSVNASVAAFYEALRSGRRPPVSGEDGLAVIEFCEAMIESAFRNTSRASEVEHHAVL